MKLKFCFSLLLVLVLAMNAHSTPLFDSNLIVNGDAENGTNGWTGTLIAAEYNATSWPASDGWKTPVDGGSHFFWPGQSGDTYARQTIDLTDYSGFIDSGTVSFELYGLFAGWFAQEDNASLIAIFKNDSGATLGRHTIGGLTPADRAEDYKAFYPDRLTGEVLKDTRSVEIELFMDHYTGGDNDSYSDNLSLKLFNTETFSSVPEPATIMLLGIGLLGLAGVSRRKQ